MDEVREWSTRHIVINSGVDNHVDKLSKHPHIQEAAQLIKAGEVVAFPTETVYGLGASALSNQAVEKIYKAKGRPSDNPLIVHVASVEQLAGVVDNLSHYAHLCIKYFWPGPLTLVLPKGEKVCTAVTAGLSTVAVRMPEHPVAKALILAAELPIAAPSANSSGRPSPTEAKHVLEDLMGKIPVVIDGGATGVGVESTVLDLTGDQPCILRPGSITKDQLEKVIGEVTIDPALTRSMYSVEADHPVDADIGIQPKSPGMKYKHYAPQGELWLVQHKGKQKHQHISVSDYDNGEAESAFQRLIDTHRSKGKQVGILVTAAEAQVYNSDFTYIYSDDSAEEKQLAALAQHLYSGLRAMDEQKIDIILMKTVTDDGLGLAIMNRLLKASSGRMVTI